jgi:hypothetical protein
VERRNEKGTPVIIGNFAYVSKVDVDLFSRTSQRAFRETSGEFAADFAIAAGMV